ncbi:MAG: hypothetical protein OXG59_03405 [Gammaproteobacteria bacterium]|nr:hypothetical protein [Gammaproteobacteria bacterium]
MTIAGRIRHLTRIGLSHMNEAVLDVLFHAYGKPAGLTAAQIHERMGLGEDFGNPPHGVVEGLLTHLEGAGSVTSSSNQVAEGETTWRLAELEYAQRCD